MNQTEAPQVALVSGAGRLLGRSAALALAREGFHLALQDLSPLNLDPLVDEIQAGGGQAQAYVFDAARQMPARALVDQVLADWGRVDLLVNCAPVELEESLFTLDEWDWHRTLDLNLTAPFLLIQAVGQARRDRGLFRVINVAVRYGSLADDRLSAATSASLAGLVGLSRQAAHELARSGIILHAVQAGLRPEPSPFSFTELLERLQAVIVFLARGQGDSWPQAVFDLEDSVQLKKLGLV